MSTEEQRTKWRHAKRVARVAELSVGKAMAVKRNVEAARQHDAIVYLRHAQAAMTEALRTGKIKQFDKAHLLTLLALSTLEVQS
jgi:hypothetical protein